jgi:hypothetical protein
MPLLDQAQRTFARGLHEQDRMHEIASVPGFAPTPSGL